MRSVLAAALGVALVPLAEATNVKLPPCLDKFQPFVSSGCFQRGKGPALVFRSGLDQYNMTVEKCVADCKGNGFRYAGLEYYGVCSCGATVDGLQVPDSQCSQPCSGNKSETCGGDQTLSVWQDPTFPKSRANVTVDDYKSLGCFSDSSAKGRALSWPVKVDGSTFTTKKCLAACDEGGFPFAGTEYGGECWCGVVLANDTVKVHESECNMPCRGDASDRCGGPSRLSLYVARDLESLEPCGRRPVTSTSSSPAVITTVTKPPYKFPNATTTIVTSLKTSSKPAETVSTTAQETTSQPQESTSSKAPGESTTTSGSASAPWQETTGMSTPGATPLASSGPYGRSTEIAPGYGTSLSSKPSEPSETTEPVGTTWTTSDLETTASSSSDISAPSGTPPPTSDEKGTTSSTAADEPTWYTLPEETTATAPGSSEVTSATRSGETGAPTEVPITTTGSEATSTAVSSQPQEPAYPTEGPVFTTESQVTSTTAWSQPEESASPTEAPVSTTESEATSTTASSEPADSASPTEAPVATTSSEATSTAASSQPAGSASPTEAPVATTSSEATSTAASLCTATSSVPSRCEWQRGGWCAPPLPDWDSRPGCEVAAKTCVLQVVSCFRYADWPHTIDCFDFQRWCRNVQLYCGDSCGGSGRCGKGDCWAKYQPGSGKPPAATTSVFPCPPGSATAKPTSPPPATSCPPSPSNICRQPSNDGWGYGPDRPVAGVLLPIVGCNDVRDDWRSRPYKLYTEPDSAKSPSFRWPERPGVCADSCREQYRDCRDTYVGGCRRLSWKETLHRRREGETDAEFARRAQPWAGGTEAADADDSGLCATAEDDSQWASRGSDSVGCWGWGGNTAAKAVQRCGAQYRDCLAVNSGVDPGDQCSTWCRSGQ